MVGKMVFGERILETQKGENSRVIMMVGHPVRFLWDWTRDGLERMAIFLASRGQTIIHPGACQVLRGAGSSAAA
jgi:hypothetical protein